MAQSPDERSSHPGAALRQLFHYSLPAPMDFLRGVGLAILLGVTVWGYWRFIVGEALEDIGDHPTLAIVVHLAVTAIFVLAFTHLLFWLQKKAQPKHRWLTLLPYGLVLLNTLLIVFLNRGGSFFFFMMVVMWSIVVLGIGMQLLAFDDDWRKNLAASLYNYCKKIVEIWIISMLIYAAGFVVVGTMAILAEVGGLEFIESYQVIEEVIYFVFTVAWTTFVFIGILLTIDFSVPLAKQQERFALIAIVRWLFAFAAVIMSVFLAMYLLYLAPTGFRALLGTGETVPLFLFVASSIGIAHLLMIRFAQTLQVPRLLQFMKVVLFLLSLEGVVFGFVAADAMWLRIDDLGITFARFWAALFVLIALVVLVRFLVLNVVSLLSRIENDAWVTKMQGSLVWLLGLLSVGVLASVLFNVEAYSVSSHLERVKNSTALSGKDVIDRTFVLSVGSPAVIDELVDGYADLTPERRADVVLTLVAMGADEHYYSFSYDRYAPQSKDSRLRDDVHDALAALQDIEKDERMSQWIATFVDDLPHKEPCDFSAKGNSCNTLCVDPLSEMLRDIHKKDTIKAFCDRSYFAPIFP